MTYELIPPSDPRVLSSIAPFDIETFKKVQAANNFKPVNTQVSDPRMMAPRAAPISSAPSPAMPMPLQTGPDAAGSRHN